MFPWGSLGPGFGPTKPRMGFLLESYLYNEYNRVQQYFVLPFKREVARVLVVPLPAVVVLFNVATFSSTAVYNVDREGGPFHHPVV